MTICGAAEYKREEVTAEFYERYIAASGFFNFLGKAHGWGERRYRDKHGRVVRIVQRTPDGRRVITFEFFEVATYAGGAE